MNDVLIIDERLKQLQEEVKMMEQQYGFSEEFQLKEVGNRLKKEDNSKQQTKKQPNRYQNLPHFVQQKEIKQQKMKAQLSNKWVEIFQEKPSIMQFYDVDRFLPTLQSPYDIQIKPTVPNDEDIYETYIDNLKYD
ncbi:unnamed protein product (macronuclear) [Paramecium tetraurelia]|uniref:Uncharacterized protein n=2 Tax=Paramecium TaxID=5884 RepID=A0C5T9_PARTE|nr:uncharacterized protein GSPATT00035285001 [Paramecium tetraurelia]CAD8213282.1 unnamed protein product [Paramecium octaurelia]CAK66156.1 unnamed protein product [Paramecium tetraurelia]|eukprot:XP_001433553.1 hypothetical protein (macronuclear) [Paramecium tetraurelia strain d4-2]